MTFSSSNHFIFTLYDQNGAIEEFYKCVLSVLNFAKKKKTLGIVFGIFCLVFYTKKKKPHNNKAQTINTDLCLCFDVMMMS